jgi:hypothetical protein
VTGNNEGYSQWVEDVPNASTNLSSQVSRARWTTVLGALFFESALFTVPLRSHLNGLHIYDPDTFRIVRLPRHDFTAPIRNGDHKVPRSGWPATRKLECHVGGNFRVTRDPVAIGNSLFCPSHLSKQSAMIPPAKSFDTARSGGAMSVIRPLADISKHVTCALMPAAY